jgi:hypothetical protein
MTYQEQLFKTIHSVFEGHPAEERKAMASAVFRTLVALEGQAMELNAAQVIVNGVNIAGDLHHQWMAFFKSVEATT